MAESRHIYLYDEFNSPSAKMVVEAYKITIEAMLGDADGKIFLELGPFYDPTDNPDASDEDLLADVVKVLNRLYSDGDDPEEYRKIEGFNDWFNQDDLDEDELEEMHERQEKLAKDWPFDPMYDRPAKYVSFEIVYYDQYGHECPVKIKY